MTDNTAPARSVGQIGMGFNMGGNLPLQSPGQATAWRRRAISPSADRRKMTLAGATQQLYRLSWRIPFFGKLASSSTPGYAAFILHHQDSAIAPQPRRGRPCSDTGRALRSRWRQGLSFTRGSERPRWRRLENADLRARARQRLSALARRRGGASGCLRQPGAIEIRRRQERHAQAQ